MFEQIMVPLDGSELAERALPCAEHLARLAGATIHLVRSVEPLPDPSRMVWVPEMVGSVPTGIYDDLAATHARETAAYLDKMHDQMTAVGVRVKTAPLTGHAAAALLDYERVADIDLVVMCSYGRSGLARFAFGSVADRLLRHGVAPVLLVRAFGAPVTLEQSVVPLDGSARAEQALHVVTALARDVLCHVTLLRVVDTPEHGPEAERYLVGVAQRVQRDGPACQYLVERGDPATTIIDTAGTDKLIVMATHGRSGLTRWALGSVADRVVHGGVAGVLLVRAGDAPRRHHHDGGGRGGHVDSVLW